MKVLQINSVCGIRSTGRICTDIAHLLQQQGHSCRIVYGREDVPEQFASISIRSDSPIGVKLHALQSRVLDNAGFARAGATKKLLQKIRDYDPDVIHLHNVHGYFLHVPTLFRFLKEYGRPVIWTFHDCWPFTGHCTYFDKIGCQRWKTGCYDCPQKKRYPSSHLLDRSRSNYQKKMELFSDLDKLTIVTPSQWLADLAGESFLKNIPLRVIHNGIDVETFRPLASDFRCRYRLEGKKIVLGVASSFDKGKGFDDFVELSRRLEAPYQIVMVGLTPEQLPQLPDNILGICRTDSVRQLAEIYSAADVFINPTYEDNYPTTNLEAQCCGTPAITYRTGGSIESVPAEQVVTQGDLDALEQKIRLICETGNYAVKDRELFDKNRAFKAYIDLYNEVLR